MTDSGSDIIIRWGQYSRGVKADRGEHYVKKNGTYQAHFNGGREADAQLNARLFAEALRSHYTHLGYIVELQEA